MDVCDIFCLTPTGHCGDPFVFGAVVCSKPAVQDSTTLLCSLSGFKGSSFHGTARAPDCKYIWESPDFPNWRTAFLSSVQILSLTNYQRQLQSF